MRSGFTLCNSETSVFEIRVDSLSALAAQDNCSSRRGSAGSVWLPLPPRLSLSTEHRSASGQDRM
eukprot:5983847-Amphidinium_carterae.2